MAESAPHEAHSWQYHDTSIVSRGQGRKKAETDERLRILLVDDDVRLCDSLAALLSVVGYDVTNVYSGAEALALLGERGFDAVIIDVNLPDMEGVRLLERVKGKDGDAGTLMLSGKASFEHAVESLNHGADAFLLKPTDPDDLIVKLEKVTRLKRLERDLRASEERYRNLFENIGDGAFQMDLDGNYTGMNQAGAEILGYDDPVEVVEGAMRAWDTFTSREEYEALRMKVILEGEVRRTLRRFRRRCGSLGWLETTIRTRRDDQGNLVGLEGIFRDISDRIRYQEMLEALYCLWADLGEVETVEEAGDLTLEFLRAMLGIDRGMFSVIEGEVIKPVREGDEGQGYEEYPVKGQNIVSRAVRTGEAQLVPDATDDMDWSPASNTDGELIRSELAVPVKMVDGIVGVIHIARLKPTPFTSEDQKLVEIVAERVALALERIVRSKIGSRSGLSLKDFL
jgi:PAS domain S-box-containing protein